MLKGALFYLLCAIVLLQSALLWRVCELHAQVMREGLTCESPDTQGAAGTDTELLPQHGTGPKL